MLIQAYCQQEREKRCTITAKAATEPNSPSKDESNDVEKMDTDETVDQTSDGTKTPKIEPNVSPTPNDVEMIDTTEPVTVIKQEPEDEVTSVDIDPLADGDGAEGGASGDGDNTRGSDRGSTDENSTSAIKNDAKSDNQQSGNKTIKIESDDNGNDCNSESNKENPSESTSATANTNTNTTGADEPIKIEESTADKDDPYSKDINIDPRTYCKLGHFHLLLEDYAKGKENKCALD